MNRNFFFSAAIGLAFGFTAAACGPTSSACSSTNCPAGCCDANGECQTPSPNTCGFGGHSCTQCGIGQNCSVAGTCVGGISGNGGGTGNTTGGGNGTTGGGTTTAGGNGTTGGGTTTAGGDGSTGGGTTTAGGNGTTGGGTTTAGGNGTTGGGTTTAGGNGTTGGGSGTTGGGSGTPGVGSPCTSTAECAGLTNGYCRLNTTAQNGFAATPYVTGFCTVDCNSTTCPGGSVCAGGEGSILNWRNETAKFCTPSCSTFGTACASNLKCTYVDDLSASASTLGCWMDWSGRNAVDAGTVPFTGGGYPVNVGSPCTMSSQCQHPPDYLLGLCVTNSAFPGGMCIADTSYADDRTWCQGAGKVVMWDNNADGGDPEFYFCAQGCSAVGDTTGLRSGYTCWNRSYDDTTPVLVMWPTDCTTTADCSNYATALPQYQWSCNTTAGFCCTGDAGCITTLR